ncbi:MAG: uncharacterized protein A8A55_2560 [Amphiamblys sp. WSBS2006]|nr:MAG: uncharacterized protein A8A55_2560 [Amphiamblys sp. WSBS2006]
MPQERMGFSAFSYVQTPARVFSGTLFCFWVFHCPAWEDGRLAADKETGITIGERDRWTPSIPIDIVCGEMSLEERTKRYKWLAVFFTVTASKKRAVLGNFDLPGRVLGRPFRDIVTA